MQLDFMRTAARSYMIVKDISYPYEEFELQMQLNNHIPGLLDLQVICTNGAFEYWYDITGTIDLRSLLGTKAAGQKELAGCIRQICDERKMLENYFLDANDLVYRPSMLYLDKAGGKLQFCCIPGFRTEQENGMKCFMEEILKYADHSDPKAVKDMYAVYEQCANPDARIEDLLELVSDEEDVVSEAAAGMQGGSAGMQKAGSRAGARNADGSAGLYRAESRAGARGADGSAGVYRAESYADAAERPELLRDTKLRFEEDSAFDPEDPLFVKETAKQGRRPGRRGGIRSAKAPDRDQGRRHAAHRSSGLFRREKAQETAEELWRREGFDEVQPAYTDTCYAGTEEGATVLLSPLQTYACPKLVYCGRGSEQDLNLDHFPYLIGKNGQQADGVLTADTVSRLHARVLKEDGEYLIEDMNSTNGTYVNGMILPARTPAPLRVNDRVVFGSEEFVLNERFFPAADEAADAGEIQQRGGDGGTLNR